MKVRTVRNKKQLRDTLEVIANERLPLKVAYTSLYPTRSIDVNSYYWGIVLKRISDETGANSLELHEFFKTLFNFGYNWHGDEVVVKSGSTAGMDHPDFWDYVEKVRLYAELDLGIVIETEGEVML
jgi:hypothetical protein